MPSLLRLETRSRRRDGAATAAGPKRGSGATRTGASPVANAPAAAGAPALPSATRREPTPIADLLRTYLPRLQRFVRLRLGALLRRREDTLDIVQSTVREVLEEQRFEWRGEVEFRAWLFQVALNKIRQKGRFHGAGKRAVEREDAVGPSGTHGAEAVEDLATPSRVAMAREELQRLEGALAQLTESQREVLTLSRVAGLPHAAIAQQLGKSEVAVRQLLVRAMAALGAALGPASRS